MPWNRNKYSDHYSNDCMILYNLDDIHKVSCLMSLQISNGILENKTEMKIDYKIIIKVLYYYCWLILVYLFIAWVKIYSDFLSIYESSFRVKHTSMKMMKRYLVIKCNRSNTSISKSPGTARQQQLKGLKGNSEPLCSWVYLSL